MKANFLANYDKKLFQYNFKYHLNVWTYIHTYVYMYIFSMDLISILDLNIVNIYIHMYIFCFHTNQTILMKIL